MLLAIVCELLMKVLAAPQIWILAVRDLAVRTLCQADQELAVKDFAARDLAALAKLSIKTSFSVENC